MVIDGSVVADVAVAFFSVDVSFVSFVVAFAADSVAGYTVGSITLCVSCSLLW